MRALSPNLNPFIGLIPLAPEPLARMFPRCPCVSGRLTPAQLPANLPACPPANLLPSRLLLNRASQPPPHGTNATDGLLTSAPPPALPSANRSAESRHQQWLPACKLAGRPAGWLANRRTDGRSPAATRADGSHILMIGRGELGRLAGFDSRGASRVCLLASLLGQRIVGGRHR